jgi:hypothetical protein
MHCGVVGAGATGRTEAAQPLAGVCTGGGSWCCWNGSGTRIPRRCACLGICGAVVQLPFALYNDDEVMVACGGYADDDARSLRWRR